MNTNVGFYLSHDIKITLKKMHFWLENVQILPYFTQRYNGRYYVMLLICKPLVVYWFYWMALYYSQTWRHVINDIKTQMAYKYLLQI